MTDAERELHIKHCGELMQAAHARGDLAEARQWLDAQYEAAKHAWLNQNLDCTAHEYESAMRRILKEIGL